MDMSPIAARAFGTLLEKHTGQQLAPGRRWRLDTALQPILRRHDIASLDALAGRVSIEQEAGLTREVVEALLNHETSFYRDFAAFRSIADEALPSLGGVAAGRRLRIWSAGCSTGQEPYSLAMLAADDARWGAIDILASDVSPIAIAQARDGLYSQFEAQRGMPITQLLAHFDLEDEAWRIHAALRGRVTWTVHNLLDPPPGRFDLILCRNVLLYFASETRARVFERLAEACLPHGLLMLGAGETVLGQTGAFVPDPALRGYYRLRDGG